MIKFKILSIALCLLFLLIGCSKKTNLNNTQPPQDTPQSSDSEQTAVEADIEGMDFTFSTRDTNDTYNSDTAKASNPRKLYDQLLHYRLFE